MRIEKDTIGKLKLSDNVYFGIQTKRAKDNFPISGLRLQRRFIKAQGIIKLAAARANGALGLIKGKPLKAIEKAALEVVEGRHDKHFVVDVYQAGAGTSQNMNANEVIANRAIELLNGMKGDYRLINPNDQVNMAQSTNDTIPASMYISAAEALREELFPSLGNLQKELLNKSRQFNNIVKAGRTHLQDAVPIRLGQEFSGYAESVKKDISRIKEAYDGLLYLPIGGNAVGTGINAHPGFRGRVIREIRKVTGIKFRGSSNLFEGILEIVSSVSLAIKCTFPLCIVKKSTMDTALSSNFPNASLPFLFKKLSGSSPSGSGSTFTLNPFSNSVPTALFAAFIPAESPSKTRTTSCVSLLTSFPCSCVNAVPRGATAFKNPWAWADITSRYPSIRIANPVFLICSFAAFRP